MTSNPKHVTIGSWKLLLVKLEVTFGKSWKLKVTFGKSWKLEVAFGKVGSWKLLLIKLEVGSYFSGKLEVGNKIFAENSKVGTKSWKFFFYNYLMEYLLVNLRLIYKNILWLPKVVTSMILSTFFCYFIIIFDWCFWSYN